MKDPIEEALAWLGTALMCELESGEADTARYWMIQAEMELERLKAENATLKKQVDSLWVGRRHWDGDDS